MGSTSLFGEEQFNETLSAMTEMCKGLDPATDKIGMFKQPVPMSIFNCDLMQAVGNEILKTNPAAKVLYLHSQRFVQDMVKALPALMTRLEGLCVSR